MSQHEAQHEPQHVTVLFTGILVCVPLLALQRFGFFPELAARLADLLPRLLVLPEEGLRATPALQYGLQTLLAFLGAWVGARSVALWLKFALLLALGHLLAGFTLTLAWSGWLFEPASGFLAAAASCLIGVICADLEQRRESEPEAKAPAGPASAPAAESEIEPGAALAPLVQEPAVPAAEPAAKP
jgi:hypothetical protein